jgi:hypothetical protein
MFAQDKLWKAKLISEVPKEQPTLSFADPETEPSSYLETLQNALQLPTRQAAQLPSPDDLTFHSVDHHRALSVSFAWKSTSSRSFTTWSAAH